MQVYNEVCYKSVEKVYKKDKLKEIANFIRENSAAIVSVIALLAAIASAISAYRSSVAADKANEIAQNSYNLTASSYSPNITASCIEEHDLDLITIYD